MTFLTGNDLRSSEDKTLSCESPCYDVIFTLVQWGGYLEKWGKSYSCVLPDNITLQCGKYVN
jgi:hypothetical protein